MKIVKIKGGLGNQMFQYAFAKCLENFVNEEVKIDMTTYRNLINDSVRKPRILNFCLDLDIATDEDIKRICIVDHGHNSSLSYKYKLSIVFERMLNRKYFFEKDRRYRAMEDIFNFKYFDGYWQCWRYVDACFKEIQKNFVPNYVIDKSTSDLITKISAENSVFIGIRKGDYETELDHYGTFDQYYYDKAISIIEEKIRNPIYYIFSNDIEWTKNNLNFGCRKVIYRENEDVVSDFEELLLMANCKHSIIINSTYHWWGAKLNYYDGKLVVAPKRWFFDNMPIDIVPPEWIRI